MSLFHPDARARSQQLDRLTSGVHHEPDHRSNSRAAATAAGQHRPENDERLRPTDPSQR